VAAPAQLPVLAPTEVAAPVWHRALAWHPTEFRRVGMAPWTEQMRPGIYEPELCSIQQMKNEIVLNLFSPSAFELWVC